jgi:hypothetical protein
MNTPLRPECDKIILIEQGRAWTDNTHVTHKDAPKLGEFVETGSAKEIADGGQIGSWIREQMRRKLGGISPHTAKLGHKEQLVILAHTLRPVEYLAPRTYLNSQCKS